MLVENTREEALKAFLNGSDVRIAVNTGNGPMAFISLGEMVPPEAVYFINVDLAPGEDYEEKVLQRKKRMKPETDILSADRKPGEAVGTKKENDQKAKPKRRTTGEIIEPYVRQGLSDSEIAKKTGIKYTTVWEAAKKIRERMAETKGKNADRHLCRTCKYRAAAYYPNGTGIKCEYALKSGTKNSRGCDVEDCDKYEKGAPIKVKDEA